MKDIETIVCNNDACRYGIDGRPKVAIKKRAHKEYCCAICRNEAHRNKQSGGAKVRKLEKEVEALKFTVGQLVDFVLGRITKDEVSEIIKKVEE